MKPYNYEQKYYNISKLHGPLYHAFSGTHLPHAKNAQQLTFPVQMLCANFETTATVIFRCTSKYYKIDMYSYKIQSQLYYIFYLNSIYLPQIPTVVN